MSSFSTPSRTGQRATSSRHATRSAGRERSPQGFLPPAPIRSSLNTSNGSPEPSGLKSDTRAGLPSKDALVALFSTKSPTSRAGSGQAGLAGGRSPSTTDRLQVVGAGSSRPSPGRTQPMGQQRNGTGWAEFRASLIHMISHARTPSTQQSDATQRQKGVDKDDLAMLTAVSQNDRERSAFEGCFQSLSSKAEEYSPELAGVIDEVAQAVLEHSKDLETFLVGQNRSLHGRMVTALQDNERSLTGHKIELDHAKDQASNLRDALDREGAYYQRLQEQLDAWKADQNVFLRENAAKYEKHLQFRREQESWRKQRVQFDAQINALQRQLERERKQLTLKQEEVVGLKRHLAFQKDKANELGEKLRTEQRAKGDLSDAKRRLEDRLRQQTAATESANAAAAHALSLSQQSLSLPEPRSGHVSFANLDQPLNSQQLGDINLYDGDTRLSTVDKIHNLLASEFKQQAVEEVVSGVKSKRVLGRGRGPTNPLPDADLDVLSDTDSEVSGAESSGGNRDEADDVSLADGDPDKDVSQDPVDKGAAGNEREEELKLARRGRFKPGRFTTLISMPKATKKDKLGDKEILALLTPQKLDPVRALIYQVFSARIDLDRHSDVLGLRRLGCPEFVYDYLVSASPTVSGALEVARSYVQIMTYARNSDLLIDLFCSFLEGEYDTECFNFFLYVREFAVNAPFGRAYPHSTSNIGAEWIDVQRANIIIDALFRDYEPAVRATLVSKVRQGSEALPLKFVQALPSEEREHAANHERRIYLYQFLYILLRHFAVNRRKLKDQTKKKYQAVCAKGKNVAGYAGFKRLLGKIRPELPPHLIPHLYGESLRKAGTKDSRDGARFDHFWQLASDMGLFDINWELPQMFYLRESMEETARTELYASVDTLWSKIEPLLQEQITKLRALPPSRNGDWVAERLSSHILTTSHDIKAKRSVAQVMYDLRRLFIEVYARAGLLDASIFSLSDQGHPSTYRLRAELDLIENLLVMTTGSEPRALSSSTRPVSRATSLPAIAKADGDSESVDDSSNTDQLNVPKKPERGIRARKRALTTVAPVGPPDLKALGLT